MAYFPTPVGSLTYGVVTLMEEGHYWREDNYKWETRIKVLTDLAEFEGIGYAPPTYWNQLQAEIMNLQVSDSDFALGAGYINLDEVFAIAAKYDKEKNFF